MRLKDLGNLANVYNEIKNLGSVTKIAKSSIKLLEQEFKDLSETELAMKLASSGLSNEFKQQIGTILGVELSTATLSASQTAATGTTIGLKTAISGLGQAFHKLAKAHPALLALTVTLAAIGAAVKVYDLANESLEEAQEKTVKAKQEYDELTSQISALENKSAELCDRLQELYALQNNGTITLVEENELRNLVRQNNELEREIRNKKALAQMEGKQASDAAVNAITKQSEEYKIENSNLGERTGGYTIEHGDRIDAASHYIEQASKYKESLKSFQEQQEKIEQNYGYNPSKYMQDIQWISLNDDITFTTKNLSDAEILFIEYIQELNEESKALYDQYGNIIDGAEETVFRLDALFNKQDIYKSGGQTAVDKTVEYFNNSANKAVIDKLKAVYMKYAQGSIPQNALESMQEYSDIMESTGITASYLTRYLGDLHRTEQEIAKVKAYEGFMGSFQNLPIDKIEKYVSLVKSSELTKENIGSFDLLSMLMRENKISAEDTIEALKGFSESYTTTSELISSFEHAKELLGSIKDEVNESGKVSSNSLTSIVKQYPELQAAIGKYHQDLITTNELLTLMESAYENDANAFRAAMALKLSDDEIFFENIKNCNKILFSDLANTYGNDVNNWKTLAEAKKKIEIQLLQQLSGLWGAYYGSFDKNIKTDKNGMYYYVTDDPTADSESGVQAIKAQISRTNRTLWELKKAAEVEIVIPDFNNINTSKPISRGEQTQEQKDQKNQTYALTDRRKSKLEKEHDIIEEMTNDENIAYENQLSLLSDLIELDNKRKQFADKTAANYAKDWSDAQGNILQAINGSNYNFDDIINYIKEGHDRNLEFVGDDIVASIDAAIVAWDIMNEYEEYSANLQKEINEHLEKQRQIRLDIANAQADEISAKANKLQSQIDLIEAKGGIASEDMLRRQIRISKDLEDSHRNQINALEDMLDNADPLSAEYYNIKSQIEGCKNDIIQCQIEQANWNEELLNLPIRRVERYLELLANIKQDLTNFIDVQTASGQATTLDQYQELIGLTNEQMDSLMQKHDELQNKLSNYKYGSDKFNEVQSDIQSVEDEIASLIKSTKEWISEILNIPINSIQKVNSELSNIVKNMGDILSDYDTAINAVTGTIDKQIESINDLSDAANKEYQDKIDPLQNELDLLQKQNDARKTELALEQAQYDLERAKNQKTNKVVRNGEIVYEADQEALRNANAANADAEYNKTIDTLESQIEALENQRDEILEGYDQQLEKLDEIKERWSKIASDVQLATDSLKADELLGKGWQDKVLSGNDSDIFKAMKDWYSSLATQQNQYEQQIDSNERIAALMEQFAALYQDGSITYEQAMAGIQNLTAQLGNGFTALENLNALLQIGGADSLSSLLDKAQNNATQSVSQMADYLKAVKQNSDALADYVMTWDEMKQNIKDQVEALKAAAEALKNRPVSKPSSSHDDDDDRGYRGPTDTYVNGEYVHTNDGWGNYYDKNTGEKVDDPAKNLDTILDKHKKHDGIESGLIGHSDMTRERMLKSLATNSLKPNETLSKVLVGEAVLTKKQQEQLLKNFQLTSSISTPAISLPEVASVNDAQSNVEVNMGNIVLQGVQDPDGLARAIKQNLSGIMRQELHKR